MVRLIDESRLTFGYSDVLQKKDNGGNRKFRCECSKELLVNMWLTDVLEASRDSEQQLDGIFSTLALSVATVEPRSNGQSNNDEGIPEDADEEEQAFWEFISNKSQEASKITHVCEEIFSSCTCRSIESSRGIRGQ